MKLSTRHRRLNFVTWKLDILLTYFWILTFLLHLNLPKHVWRTSRGTLLGFNDDLAIFWQFSTTVYHRPICAFVCVRLQLGLGGCKVILPIFILWIFDIILWIRNSLCTRAPLLLDGGAGSFWNASTVLHGQRPQITHTTFFNLLES